MNLAEKYSKSILKKFDVLPVYYPGTEVKPGDIISFGTNLFGKAKRPIGTFSHIGSLINGETYNLNLKTIEDKYNKPINFVSENEVTVSAAVSGEYPNVATGDVKFSFGKEGSILVLGKNAREIKITDQFSLEAQLKPYAKDRDWDDFYIVTSVVVCEKALVYQSNASNGTLIVSASANEINISNDIVGNIDASVSFDVKWKNNAAFAIDWTDNVTLLMKLVQFKNNKIKGFEKAAGDIVKDGNNDYGITEVNTQGLFED